MFIALNKLITTFNMHYVSWSLTTSLITNCTGGFLLPVQCSLHLLPVQTPIGHFVSKGGIQDEKMLRRKRRFLASHTHLSGFKRGNTSFIRRKKVEYKF